jgi:predicted transcriptional regulator
MKQRTGIEITHDILEAALTAQTKTRIMYVAGLYSKQVNSYLSVLVRAGLLETVGDRNYKTTVKGTQFMRSFERLRSIAFVPEWDT